MSAADGRLVPSDAVSIERVGEEGVLHDARHGRVHVINASAVRVWELCASRPTPSELAARLAASYGMEPEAVRGDVEAVVRDFRARGLLEP